MRECVPGEQYTSDNRCEECPENSYSYNYQTSNEGCHDCDTRAICEGRDIVYPQATYWRNSSTSENFIECPNTEACL